MCVILQVRKSDIKRRLAKRRNADYRRINDLRMTYVWPNQNVEGGKPRHGFTDGEAYPVVLYGSRRRAAQHHTWQCLCLVRHPFFNRS